MKAMFNCAIAFASSVWMAFAGDDASDIELSQALDVEVPTGETWTYSGVISGSGSIFKHGGGKLVLSKENTFSGGVTITNGMLEVAEQGALGSGMLTIKNPSKDPDISVKFSKKDAVVINDIKFPHNGSNAGDGNPHIHVMENTTFRGAITSYANTCYIGNEDHSKGSIDAAYPTNTIEGSVWTYGTRSLSFTTYGVTILKGPVQVGGSICVGVRSSSTGSLVLDTDNCNVKAYHLWSGSLYCKRPNVLNGAKLDIRQNDASSASHIDLGGFDQTCSTLDKYSTGTAFPTTGEGFSIDSPAGPATLTVTGGAANASCNCYFSINDQITLLLDADPTFTCNFTKRANGTSGDIIVSKGVFSVTDTATFKAVTRINVAQNGQFILSSTETEALLGVRDLEVSGVFRSTANAPFSADEVRLVINEGATFDIGTALKVASFRIRGVDLDGGTYTHSDYSEIAEGTTIIVPTQKLTKTWVGGGSDQLISTAANWSGETTPNLTGGGLTAVFAEGGSSALIDRMLYLDGIVFSGENGFTLSKQGDAGGVSLLGAGLSFTAASGNPERTFTLDVPVEVTEAQLWTIPDNTTFELRDGFAAQNDVVKGGDGNLVFSGTNSFAGALVITNGITTFSGIITTPNGVDGSEYSADNSIQCYGATASSKGTLTGRVYLDNAVIEKPFYTLGPSSSSKSEEYLWSTANSSNIIRSVWKTGSESWQRLNQPDSAITVFEGGVENTTRAHFAGGTVHIRNKPHISTANLFLIAKNTHVIYEATGGCVNNLQLGVDASVEFRASYSLDGGQITNNSTACSINLNCTTQRFERICFGNAPNVIVDGAYGSALEVSGSGNSIISANLTNGVSVVNKGSGVLTLAGRTFASNGDIVAESGTVEIAADASLKNVSRICASGSGTVAVLRTAGNLMSQAFGKDTQVYLSGDGIISIPDGSVQRVAYLFVDGERQPLGSYTYANIADENVKKHFAQTSGTLKCIGNPGTVISIR